MSYFKPKDELDVNVLDFARNRLDKQAQEQPKSDVLLSSSGQKVKIVGEMFVPEPHEGGMGAYKGGLIHLNEGDVGEVISSSAMGLKVKFPNIPLPIILPEEAVVYIEFGVNTYLINERMIDFVK